MEIRLIADGEAESSNDFHNRLYKKRRTLTQWRWDFIENTFNDSTVPYAVVADKGNIVGTQALIPIQMIDSGGIYWTAKSEETLVDPEYRGRQLFEKMYRFLFDYGKEKNFLSIWGFTPAIKAFNRLGFLSPVVTSQIFFPFSVRSVPVLIESSIKSSVKRTIFKIIFAGARLVSTCRLFINCPGMPENMEIRTLDSAPPDSGKVCESFIKKWGGRTIYRDEAYLNWRIINNPYVKGIFRGLYYKKELIGWVIYALGDDGMGYLVDLMLDGADRREISDLDIIRLLLSDAVDGTRKMGAVGIRGWQVNNHSFDKLVCRAARQIGFYHIKRGHSVVLYISEAGRERGGIEKIDDWYITRIFTEGVLG